MSSSSDTVPIKVAEQCPHRARKSWNQFQSKTRQDSKKWSISAERNKWFNVGNTGNCEVEWGSAPKNFVYARVLVAFPFFVLEIGNEFSIHFQSTTLECEDAALSVEFETQYVINPTPGFSALAPWMKYLQNPFSADVDLYFRESRPQNSMGYFKNESLVNGSGRPSELFTQALEFSFRKHFKYECSVDDFDWSSLLESAVSYQFFQQYGFGLLEPFLELEGLKEILVNRFDEVYVETQLGLEASAAKFCHEFHFERLIENLLHRLECRLDASTPVVQGVVRSRYRLHIVSKHIVPSGPSLSIRCFPTNTFQVSSLISEKGHEGGVCAYLKKAVTERKNIVVCGETSSGKTSLLEALSEFFAPHERVIVLEDVRELRLMNKHKIYMQTVAGLGELIRVVDLRDLVKESLRMRPDRLIIGECRGGEALDLLQALNTGHAGSLTSVHGSCPETALQRLETLAQFNSARVSRETVSSLLGSGLDLVVHMKRGSSGKRYVSAIAEVMNSRTRCSKNDENCGEQILHPILPTELMPAYTLRYIYSE